MKTKISFHDHCIMSNFLSKTRYHIAFEIFKKGGSKMETNKRMMQMFLFGGTIGWSRTPMFHIGMSEKFTCYHVLWCHVALETMDTC